MTDTAPALDAYLAQLGVTSRRHRDALQLLTRPHTLHELVDRTALSRRAVEQLVRALQVDGVLGVPGPLGYVLDDPDLARRYAAPPVGAGPSLDELTERLAPLVAAVPAPDRHLDHVQATPRSVARRARWMADELYLPGATVAFVGDHDLTSVALAMVAPDVNTVVVDLDARLLDYLAGVLTVPHRLRHLDLRDPLPGDLLGVADVFVTDPPYTPEGVELFVARGLSILRPGLHTRGLLAYGYGEQLPTLGLKVQQALLGLNVALVEMVRDFGRYDGAYAVGAASDWYVLAPTPRTPLRLARFADRLLDQRIYTHGRQSLESSPPDEPTDPSPSDHHTPPTGPSSSGGALGAAADKEAMRRSAGATPAGGTAALVDSVLSRRAAATLRAAAVDALLKAARAAGLRPSRGDVRDAVEPLWAGFDPDGRVDGLSVSDRHRLVAALVDLATPTGTRDDPTPG